MEEFRKALDSVIKSCSSLSLAWENLNDQSFVLDKYPFDKDFRQVLSDLVEWRDSLR
ncbi:hypothetical protein AAC03nite_26300 [Alicyclobacillus acidoterrestris]|nr:hypothetical protein AAC03nite_26300 [Alicyclobacillus acidoterrestris]